MKNAYVRLENFAKYVLENNRVGTIIFHLRELLEILNAQRNTYMDLVLDVNYM